MINYEPLLPSSLEIRLLILQATNQNDDDVVCHLETVNLIDNPEYEALSYVWGKSQGGDGILINGHRQTVTVNLKEALWCLRPQYGTRRIWVDAVCINQQDLKERASQVVIMGKIYSKATRAVVWLGKSQGSLVEDVKFFSADKDAHHTEAPWDLLGCTEEGTWWDRVWTLQESVLSRDLLFHIGLDSFSFIELRDYITSLIEHLHSLNACCYKKVYRSGLDSRAKTIYSALWLRPINGVADLINQRAKQDDYDLLSLVSEHCHRGATDPRDKIFAFVGMVNDVPDQFVDYTKPLSETLLYCAKSLMQASNDVKFLCHVIRAQRKDWNHDISSLPGGSSIGYEAEALDLPTWCPDWTQDLQPGLGTGIRATRREYRYLHKTFSAGANTTASIRFPSDRHLGVSGLIADTIKAVGVCHTGTGQTTADEWVNLWCRFLAQFVDDKLCSGCNHSTYSERNVCTVCPGFTYCAECMRNATHISADHEFYCDSEMQSRRVYLTREALENNPSLGIGQALRIYLPSESPGVRGALFARRFDSVMRAVFQRSIS